MSQVVLQVSINEKCHSNLLQKPFLLELHPHVQTGHKRSCMLCLYALHALRAYVPTCLTCSRALRAYVPTCFRAFASYVSSIFSVPYCYQFFTCLTCLPFFTCLTWLHFLRALRAFIFLRVFMCLYFLKCFQFLTCVMCLHLFCKTWNKP